MARFVPTEIDPTREQIEIQTSDAHNLIVQANAGAAKTTTLALRIGEALATGVEPERLLALTFTAPACRALTGALSKIGVPHAQARRVPVLTFDEFAANVLLSIERRPVVHKATPEALAPFVWEAVRKLDMSADEGIVERFLKVSQRIKGTLGRDRLLWEGGRITPDSAEDLGVEPSLLRLFGAYERLRYPRADGADRPRFRGDFDASYDLARLLADPESDTPVAEISGWPRRIEHLLIDEMHDLNFAMFTIVRALLRTPGTRLCGVGDFDQIVHTTAGAERRFMDRDVDFGGGRRVLLLPLTATRRFGTRLARAAGRLAQKDYASEIAHETAITCQLYAADSAGTCEGLAAAAAQKWKTPKAALLAELAILLRHPSQSVLLENELLRAGLPYSTLGFESYLVQPEVLLVRGLLAVALGDFASLSAEATRRRLVRSVVFFCGVTLTHADDERETPEERLDEAIEHVAGEAAALGPFFEFQVLRNVDPAMARRLRAAIEVARGVRGPAMFPRFLEALQMDAWVRDVFVEKQRRADAMAYMRGLAQAATAFDTAADFFGALNQSEMLLAGAASPLGKVRRKALKAERNALTLATVSAVKGLEFDHVMLPYLSQDAFPAPLAESLVEERNLFYVGITRARRHLTLLVSGERPSEFVAAAGFKVTPA